MGRARVMGHGRAPDDAGEREYAHSASCSCRTPRSAIMPRNVVKLAFREVQLHERRQAGLLRRHRQQRLRDRQGRKVGAPIVDLQRRRPSDGRSLQAVEICLFGQGHVARSELGTGRHPGGLQPADGSRRAVRHGLQRRRGADGGRPETSPGRYSGADNGGTMVFPVPLVQALTDSFKKYPNIPTLTGGASIGSELPELVLPNLLAPK
jgi:hypothetical protein